ncbi:tryptophan synthase subunit alpha [Homoserinibacter sp. GY 40078]|uniref:tryptophan synthase subunit alpha n=1 Tax=Homoserinibacter sp. GY 40078 TaxID=2603275 RepID=UPI0011CC4A4C|nr:tryptophan synthase subunit alpha [Homoserinibacter sp. GY 40078]TXK17336.1 tryptophan synthase subunit alpha [Homoserinibacter sp. GY 40078]
MTRDDQTRGVRRRASVEVLRAEANDERATLVMERLRAGEDPWEFMQELPTVDEIVVLTLRAELIRADNGRRPTVEVDYRMMRQIALAYPALSTTVWSMLDDDHIRRRTA